MFTAPFFDSRNIPVQVKVWLSLAISFVLFPVLKLGEVPFETKMVAFVLGVLGEICLGLIIGLSAKLIFAGVQLAGQMAGIQMGLGMARVLDPIAGAQVSLIAQLKNLLAMLVFLASNAHHLFLQALAESFRLVPPFHFHFTNSLMDQLVRLSSNMFVVSIKVGAPLIAVLLITSASLGLIARTVPQMHVFIVAMPLKIMVGFLMFLLSLPYLSSYLGRVFNGLGGEMLHLLKAMQ